MPQSGRWLTKRQRWGSEAIAHLARSMGYNSRRTFFAYPTPRLPMRLPLFVAIAPLGWVLFATTSIAADPAVRFAGDVEPIFRAHCYKCHGKRTQKAGLALHDIDGITRYHVGS